MKLITIGPSHYCEKARWALDHARIQYTEEVHLPILHRLYTRPHGRSVPILVTDHVAYNDSTSILQFANAQATEKFYDEAGEALRLEEQFDEVLGPPVRRLAYCYLSRQPTLLRRVFEPSASSREAAVLRVGAPALAFALGRAFRASPAAAERCHRRILEVFDDVAQRIDATRPLQGDRPYLVGGRFTAADLTFAALASPVLAPELLARAGRHTRVPLADFPAAFREKIEAYSNHAAGRYAGEIIAAHR